MRGSGGGGTGAAAFAAWSADTQTPAPLRALGSRALAGTKLPSMYAVTSKVRPRFRPGAPAAAGVCFLSGGRVSSVAGAVGVRLLSAAGAGVCLLSAAGAGTLAGRSNI